MHSTSSSPGLTRRHSGQIKFRSANCGSCSTLSHCLNGTDLRHPFVNTFSQPVISIDLLPIYSRYTVGVRAFYKWFWTQVEEAMHVERAEIKAHGEELNAFAEDVFLAPDWIRNGGEPPSDWATVAPGWRRRRKAEIRLKRANLGHTSVRGIAVDSAGNATVGEHPWTPITTRVP
jgi:hypothetical protein